MRTMTTMRLPDAARRLGIKTKDVYALVEDGQLELIPGDDGWPHVAESAVDDLVRQRG